METKTHLKRFEIACPAGDSFSQSDLCLSNLSILRMRSVVIMVMIQRIILSIVMVMMIMVMIIMNHDGITSDDLLVASQPSQCQSPSTPFCTIYPLHAGHTCAMFLVFFALSGVLVVVVAVLGVNSIPSHPQVSPLNDQITSKGLGRISK